MLLLLRHVAALMLFRITLRLRLRRYALLYACHAAADAMLLIFAAEILITPRADATPPRHMLLPPYAFRRFFIYARLFTLPALILMLPLPAAAYAGAHALLFRLC